MQTGDVFLGLSQKTPSSVCCEELLVKIFLSEIDSLDDIHLDCKANRILLESENYKLLQYLPHEVDPDKGNAKWHQKRQELEITLPIVQKDIFTDS